MKRDKARLALRIILGVIISPFIIAATLMFIVPGFVATGKWDWSPLTKDW